MGMDRVSLKARSSSHRGDLGMRNVFPQMGGHIGLQQGIRGGRGGRGVRQQTGFLVNQSEQGKGNDAANSIPVANPVVPEKKTWVSVVATNQRSAVKQSTNIQGGSQTVLHVESLGHARHAFIGITWPCPFCNSYFLGLRENANLGLI